MDIMSIIDKYVEISVRVQKLQEEIESEKRGINYAQIEGDMAFYEKDYDLERRYNNSANWHKKNVTNAQHELSQAKQLLEFVHQKYEQAIETMDPIQIKETAIKVSAKKEEIERKIEQLSQRRSWAQSKGDDAFKNHNFNEEQEYNKISSDCYLEIERISPSLHYYNAFVANLDYRANQQFESKGPKR